MPPVTCIGGGGCFYGVAMKKYQIIIEETIVDDFSIEAESPEEAFHKAEQMYKSGKIVLENGEVHKRRIAVNDTDCENLIDFREF